MENVLVYDKTGQQYMLDPRPQDLQRGVIQYVPELHSHLLAFVTVNGQTYSNNPELVDWDKGVEEWQESLMGQWPFGNKPSDEQLAIQEAIDCLECLESYLDFEEWQMDKIEEQENDDDDDDDDGVVDIWSEDEGYDSEEEEEVGFDVDNWIFGLAPMLMMIEL